MSEPLADLAYFNLAIIVQQLADWPTGRLRLVMWADDASARFYCQAINVDRVIVIASSAPTMGRAIEEFASSLRDAIEAVSGVRRPR